MVLTVTGRANYSTFSCTTASDPVTVPSVATPTITLGTADICPFGTDTATAPEGYANYWWSVNNGYISAGDGTNSIRFSRGGYPNNPNDPITVTLFVADANGCSSAQATATVPTRTIPSPTITLGTPDICPFGTTPPPCRRSTRTIGGRSTTVISSAATGRTRSASHAAAIPVMRTNRSPSRSTCRTPTAVRRLRHRDRPDAHHRRAGDHARYAGHLPVRHEHRHGSGAVCELLVVAQQRLPHQRRRDELDPLLTRRLSRS